jgi:DNA-binding transcriptional LysR family regulator
VDKLSEFQAFSKVGETGSFTAAARALGLTPSAISKQVRSLEERLDTRLLNRTTRRVALTEAGRAFLDRVRDILQDVDDAESAAASLHAEPRGTLRVGAPMDFGRMHLARPIADFAAAHRDVVVEVEFADRLVDVLAEGLDVVVRIGALADSSLVARPLALCRRVLCASPGYLREHGRPEQPRDLEAHTRIAYTYESERSWLFEDDRGRELRIAPAVRHRSNNGEQTREMLLGGLGLALMPTFLVADDLRAGRLETFLTGSLRADIPIHALYPHRRHLSAKVRRFVDHLVSHCGPRPYWDDGLSLDAPERHWSAHE